MYVLQNEGRASGPLRSHAWGGPQHVNPYRGYGGYYGEQSMFPER